MRDEMNLSKKTKVFIVLIVLAIIIALLLVLSFRIKSKSQLGYDNEIIRSMSYELFDDDDGNVDTTENVKFSSFFLRDIDGDGYAEKIKGSCREIGSSDILYMEIIVQTEGQLKNAEIEINNQNFYLTTTLPKDNELKSNYIGNNIKKIEFETLNSGTQKLLTGIVKSGDYTNSSTNASAIGNNINNYSRNDNKIKFTGTYVKEDGTEIPISKEIELTVDWHSQTAARIKNTTQNYYDIVNRINEEKGEFTASFYIETSETVEELILSHNYVEGTIPQLNGYNPKEVKLKNGNGDFSYDEETRKFTIIRNASTDSNGSVTNSISRTLNNVIEIVYPIEAYYSLGAEQVSIKIPIATFYEGYNNPNPEFNNPYRSNTATATLIANYSKERGTAPNIYIRVGKYVNDPSWHYMISKRKPIRLYNEVSSEEKDDLYTVVWEAFTGSNGNTSGMFLKETKNGDSQVSDSFIKSNNQEETMEEITSNVGIYFSNADSLLGADGTISIYNDETNELIKTFTQEEWNTYNSTTPYKYDNPVKHIKIVTSETKSSSSLYVYNIKELDDEKIFETYTKSEFEKLSYIKSNVSMYIDGRYLATKTHQAYYEAPYSLAKIRLSKTAFSTQITEKGVDIIVDTIANEENNQTRWTDGIFLIKIPDEIIDIKINEVFINNILVDVNSSEIIENEKGRFIKIITSNSTAESYTITINTDITPDPRIGTSSKKVDLYAINKESDEYYSSGEDIYDIDGDENITEIINKTSTSINLVAPSSLLTNQTISEFDNDGNIIVSPGIADLKPVYGDEDLEKQTVMIGSQIKNNYSSTISEIIMIGKIPFEGNTYILNGGDLHSDFSTNITSNGITVPTELQGKVDIYYSENEAPSKELNDQSNGWMAANSVSDWSKIKSWAVDFRNVVLDSGEEYTFFYTVEIPIGIELNKIAYSHHGVYFCLDTPEGKYKTQIEPNKIGVRVAEKYNLSLTKYQKNLNKLISGATYRVSKLDLDGNIEESQTAITNANGLLRMTNLYAEKVYEIKEIATPKDYELNSDIIKVIAHVNRTTGELTLEKLSGTTKDDIQIVKNPSEDYKIIVNVEDEANARLVLVKYEKGTSTLVRGTKYTLKGYGLPDEGKALRTNIQGEASVSGLKVGEEYTLKEIKATEGYYLNDGQIKFSIDNNGGTYEINISEGIVKNSTLTQENNLPIARVELEDEKIPTYNMTINKIEKDSITDTTPKGKPIIGAKFKLFHNNQSLGTYETNSEGHIYLNNLYLFEEDKNIEQIYTLKEVYVPEGYAKTGDFTFTASKINDNIEFQEMVNGNDTPRNFSIDANSVSVIIEDNLSFKLVKRDKDTNEPLANAKFSIYNSIDDPTFAKDNNGDYIGQKEIIDGQEYYVVSSNANGEVTANLPDGVYRIKEIQAPNEKYEVPTDPWYFGIGISQAEQSNLVKKIDNPRASGFCRTNDGGYVMLEGKDVIKYSHDDQEDWRITLNELASLICVAQTKDGGYAIGGSTDYAKITFENGVETNSNVMDFYNGRRNGCLIKLDGDGNIEWGRLVGKYMANDNYIYYIDSLPNGDIVVQHYNNQASILGVPVRNNYAGWYNMSSVFIRLDLQGNAICATQIYCTQYSDNNTTHSLKVDKNGNVIVAGNINESDTMAGEIPLEEGGIIISYNQDLVENWVNQINGVAYKDVVPTEDGGYLAVGDFIGDVVVNGITYSAPNKSGIIIKLDTNGNALWAKPIIGNGANEIWTIDTYNDEFYSVGINLGDKATIEGIEYNKGGIVLNITQDGDVKNIYTTLENTIPNLVLKNDEEYILNKGSIYEKNIITPEIRDNYQINALNSVKEYNIITEVKINDGVKGGSISGEGARPYEKVRYNADSAREIKMTPHEGYEISSITINGQEQRFTPESDGTYKLPSLKNVLEDKHIVVSYVLSENKLTINKVDSITGRRIPGATFRFDQLEERTTPENSAIIGNLEENGRSYYSINPDNDITSQTLGNMQNSTNYYFAEQDNVLIPTNSKKYRTENVEGASSGVKSSVANSYFPIDLTGLEGNFFVVVNARVSSETGNDIGYATIKNNTTIPAFSNSDGRFIYISGTVPSEDYSYKLSGGRMYYLHIGYRKDGSQDSGEDIFAINSIKIYGANEAKYNFESDGTRFVSTNAGFNGKICNSYVPIDLTNYFGKYNINVNAQISTQSGDYGYATVTNSVSRPEYNETEGRIFAITDIQDAKNYSIEVNGGSEYYLHFGYFKDEIDNTSGDDLFTINEVNITLSDTELYHISETTNIDGQIITQVPFGKYKITEINAPQGYKPLEEPLVIDFRNGDTSSHTITIQNEAKGKVLVHHYRKDTQISVANDETFYGDLGTNYTTAPKLDIPGYSLEKNDLDEFITPSNATGTYNSEDTIVTYYYVPIGPTVIINHFIEGTEDPVLLINGMDAPREIISGNKGEIYTTSAIEANDLSLEYELASIPNNWKGIFNDETIVNYYYRVKKYGITTEVQEYEQTNILGETEKIRGGHISGENEEPYETVEYGENSIKDIIATPDEGYMVKNITINGSLVNFTPEQDGTVKLSKFLNVIENKHIIVIFAKQTSQVIVHHYFENTEQRVPSIYGGEVEDVTTTGAIGSPYVTKPTDEISNRYELVGIPSNASGSYTKNPIEVKYYYKEVPAKVYVNHLIVDTTNPVPLDDGSQAPQEIIEGYVTKDYYTKKLDNISNEYVYLNSSNNTSGQMTKEDIIVNYFYAPKAYAKVNYIIVNSDDTETIKETVDYEGIDKEEYTSHSKNFDGYFLTRKPELETKKLNKDSETIFNYYYRQNTGIVEKHIDLYSNEILFNDSRAGIVGEEYEINRRSFDNYEIVTNKKYYEKQIKDNPNILSDNEVSNLDELLYKLNIGADSPYIPNNYKGIMKEDTVEIKYYYMKTAKVIIEHYDKYSNKKIHDDTIIDGFEKDLYKAEPVQIENYDLTKDTKYLPTNSEGEMTIDIITVKFYYELITEVEVNHINVLNKSTIFTETISGHEKELYKTNILDRTKYTNYVILSNKEYYEFAVREDNSILEENQVETIGELLAKLELSEYDPYIPTNYKGEMTKEKIVVNYYYKKQAKVIIRHIDEETGKELLTEIEIKDVEDIYVTDFMEIDKYEVDKQRMPTNKEGIVTEDGIEVIYYYKKAKSNPEASTGPQTGDPVLTLAITSLIVIIILNIIEKIRSSREGTKPSDYVE